MEMPDFEEDRAGLDPQVLAELLLVQGIQHILPSQERAAEFVTRALTSIPQCTSCNACYRGGSSPLGNLEHPACLTCPVVHAGSKPGAHEECPLADNRGIRSFPLETGTSFIGQLVLQVNDEPAIAAYEPSLPNFANAVAVAAEYRYQKKTITEANVELAHQRTTLQRLVEQGSQALMQSGERFRTIADYTSGWESWIGSDGRPCWINPAVSTLTGYDVDECLAMDDYPLLIIHADDRAGMEERFNAALAGSSEDDVTFRIQRKDGSIAWMAASWQPLRQLDGTSNGYRSSARDVTEHKLAEETAHDAQNQLLELQRSRTESVQLELDAAREQLVRQTRLATIGQLVSSIAHEIRNPLGSIRNATYLLQRKLARQFSDLTKYVKIIDQEVDTASQVIEDMLEMARSKPPIALSFDLSQMVRDEFERIGVSDSVRLDLVCDPNPFVLVADRGQIRQVINNLLSNALQAINGNGEINVELQRNHEHNLILVKDNGPGIEPQFHGTVFEPLFSTKTKGCGLGLAICRQIVERHDGEIFLESATPTTDTVFCIRLPHGRT